MPSSFQEIYDARLQIVNAGVNRFAKFVASEDLMTTADPYTMEGIYAYNRLLLTPGKRGRGVLAVAGYELATDLYGTRRNEKLIGTLAGTLEGLHVMFLALDDLADKSGLRRGVPTIDAHLRGMMIRDGERNPTDDARSYTENICHIVENKISLAFLGLKTSSKVRRRAQEMLCNMNIRTAQGQGWDMRRLRPDEHVSLEQVLQTAEDKTAHYTIEMPWRLGALLGGMPDSEQEKIKPFASSIGRAFQVKDDILGTFGEPSIMGKSNRSDYDDRVRTALVAIAQQYLSEADQRKLHATLNPDTSLNEFHVYKSLLRRGGLAEASRLVTALTEEGVASLPSDWPETHRNFLSGIALSNVHRRK